MRSVTRVPSTRKLGITHSIWVRHRASGVYALFARDGVGNLSIVSEFDYTSGECPRIFVVDKDLTDADIDTKFD